jgi:hypothetical protein
MKPLFFAGCLLTSFLCLPLNFSTQTKVFAADQGVQIAQKNSSYNQYMRLGYTETRRRNYRKALLHFQKALQIRPGDQYATAAIRNVNSYIQRRTAGIVFVPAGKPERTATAGTRGSCFLKDQRAIPLIPSSKEVQLTTSANPTFFLYIPPIEQNIEGLEFMVQDNESSETVYSKTFQPVGKGGIVSVTIPKQQASLKAGKPYTWSFSVICDFNNRDKDQFIEGKIERVQNENLADQLKQVNQPLDQAMIYATAGFWENSLSTIAELRRQRPNDSEINTYWNELLKSVELGDVANQKFLPCCTAK